MFDGIELTEDPTESPSDSPEPTRKAERKFEKKASPHARKETNAEEQMASVVASQLASIGALQAGGADSTCDRLNCRYTVGVLMLFSVLVVSKGYVGVPMSCFCPSHFTDSQVDFTDSICWVTNTYYLPPEDRIPKEGAPRQVIGYYQWVGLILTCQAFMFYMPRILWLALNQRSGMAVSTITNAAIECQRHTDSDARDKALRYMTKHTGRYLREVTRKRMMAGKLHQRFVCLYGNYLSLLYLFVKFLYIVNVVGQIFLLNVFLSTDYHVYGFHVISSIVQGQPWSQSDRFPRQTMCDFKIRVLGNVQRYTVQCALPVNLFNEKIYIFIWFWFVFVAITTSTSFAIWLFYCVRIKHQKAYILKRLIAMEKLRIKGGSDETVSKFIETYLRRDGLTLLRLVSSNASDMIAAELIAGLWEDFKDHKPMLLRFNTREEAALNSIIQDPEN